MVINVSMAPALSTLLNLIFLVFGKNVMFQVYGSS